MRILWTFIWSFLLSEMMVYVNASMIGAAFHFTDGLLMSVIFTIVVLLITTTIPNDPVEQHDH